MLTGASSSGAFMRGPAVIFDLDDTLYPSNSFVAGGIRAVAVLLRDDGFTDPDPCDVLMEVLETEGPFSLFDSAFARLGVRRTPELVSRLVAAFRAHSPSISPYPGIVDLLCSLRNHGVGLGLVTDGYPQVQRSKWTALGLGHLFDAVVFCRDIDGGDHPKPDPFPFARAHHLLGEPDSVVFVGDNPSADFPAPDAFGWRTVRVCWPEATHILDGDTVINRPVARNAAELRAILSGILDFSS